MANAWTRLGRNGHFNPISGSAWPAARVICVARPGMWPQLRRPNPSRHPSRHPSRRRSHPHTRMLIPPPPPPSLVTCPPLRRPVHPPQARRRDQHLWPPQPPRLGICRVGSLARRLLQPMQAYPTSVSATPTQKETICAMSGIKSLPIGCSEGHFTPQPSRECRSTER